MATLPIGNPTLADFAKTLDPNGSVANVIDILSQTNTILQDMTFREGNLPTGHRSTIRTGLPEPTWRRLYEGVPPTKATTTQVTDSCGILEAFSEVDKDLVELNGNTAAFRLDQDRAHIEGMSQEAARTVIYGNEGVEPAAFTGFAPRFNSLSSENAQNIVNAGGTGAANTSLWLIVWSPNTVHGIFPKGSKAGLQHEDLGLETVDALTRVGDAGKMRAYRSHYQWKMGLCVPDWRYVARVANVNVASLSNVTNTKAVVEWMIAASEKIPNLAGGRACWYVNRTVRTALRFGILEKIASNLTWETVSGKRVMMFDDIPVNLTDAIVNTEQAVV